MSDPRLAVDGLGFGFGDVRILDDATFSLDAGTVTAVVGPNGSGKTTVLELLAGLRRPDTGTVERPTGDGRDVAYLPQSPAFRPWFTVAETIRFYEALSGVDGSAADALSEVGLDDVAGRRVDALSGGMTRLLGIAQALVGDPPAVLLDEPTSGLDPDVTDRIFGATATLADEGRVVVVASHDVAAVEEWADRVLLVAGGAVVADDTPAGLLDRTDADTLRRAFSALVRTERTVPAGGEA
ncbi:MAG: ABC transporter ATP-binding protein [Halobacteriaceae archaeon]